MSDGLKTSLGIWALGSMVTRFVPAGYQPQWAGETTADRVSRAVDGLGDLIDDYEFHYPQEISEENVEAAWQAELNRRVAEIRLGKVIGTPVEDVLARLRERYP